jgi:hypothetical protein
MSNIAGWLYQSEEYWSECGAGKWCLIFGIAADLLSGRMPLAFRVASGLEGE